MKITRTLDKTPGQDATHVLHWLPSYLDPDGHGCWNLQDDDAYEAGVPARGPANADLPRDASPRDLAAWAGTQLGCPVATELAYATLGTIQLRPPFAKGGKEPVYYLRPQPLADACQALFDDFPEASTDLSTEDGDVRLMLIADAAGTVYRLYRLGTGADGEACYQVIERGDQEGLFITHASAVYPAAQADAAAALLAAARVPYPAGEYTAPEVFRAAGADPADPAEIDWDARAADAAIPFTVVDGRPVCPGEATGIREGRGELWFWGEQRCADALVTATRAGVRHLLAVWRGDGHGVATPGGKIDPGETPLRAAARELEEETGLAITDLSRAVVLEPRVMPDPRGTDRAWMTSYPVLFDLGDVDELPAVAGADDAARAAWVPARDAGHFRAALRLDYTGATVFPAHRAMLADVLGEPGWI